MCFPTRDSPQKHFAPRQPWTIPPKYSCWMTFSPPSSMLILQSLQRERLLYSRPPGEDVGSLSLCNGSSLLKALSRTHVFAEVESWDPSVPPGESIGLLRPEVGNGVEDEFSGPHGQKSKIKSEPRGSQISGNSDSFSSFYLFQLLFWLWGRPRNLGCKLMEPFSETG